jgi:outer membrane protein TolC
VDAKDDAKDMLTQAASAVNDLPEAVRPAFSSRLSTKPLINAAADITAVNAIKTAMDTLRSDAGSKKRDLIKAENDRKDAQAAAKTSLGLATTAVMALPEADKAAFVLSSETLINAAADAAANAALMAQQRYASGLIDFATVLETQRTQLSAQDSVATTVASVAADHVRLYKALGGGWQ